MGRGEGRREGEGEGDGRGREEEEKKRGGVNEIDIIKTHRISLCCIRVFLIWEGPFSFVWRKICLEHF